MLFEDDVEDRENEPEMKRTSYESAYKIHSRRCAGSIKEIKGKGNISTTSIGKLHKNATLPV